MPPLGSVKDRYLRMVLERERHVMFERALLDVINTRAKPGQDAIVADNRSVQERFKRFVKLFYPNAKADEEKKERKTVSAVEAFIARNKGKNLLEGEPPVAPAEQDLPTRRRLWDTMIGTPDPKEDP